MTHKGMLPEQKTQFGTDFGSVAPHCIEFGTEDPEVVSFAETAGTGKYARLVTGYYLGFLDDMESIRGSRSVPQGIQHGFRLYASILSKIPGALIESKLDSISGESLEQRLLASFDDALLPLLSTPASTQGPLSVNIAARVQNALKLKSQSENTGTTSTFEFGVNNQGSLVFRPKPEHLNVAREVDEFDLVESGLGDYYAAQKIQLSGHCAMPITFHRQMWRKLTKTVCTDAAYIASDLQEILAITSSRVQ